MKDINSNLLNNQPPGRLRLNRRLTIVLICFGISAVFWLLIALSREYPSEMVIPVSYSNIPGKKVVVNDLPKIITVEIKTTGFRIISNSFRKSFDPIQIDVAGKMQTLVLSSGILALPSQSFLSDFSRPLGKEISITGFKPDSIILISRIKRRV
ncbi:MAG: hypothetical protein IPP51_09310 [Bacteroidetes bacterium]|nr:hypothetical protein [Bacteroidota bacterium]